MTSPAVVALLALASLVVGVVVGVVMAGRRQHGESPSPDAAVTAAVDLRGVLAALRAIAIVVDADLRVLEASPAAYVYRLVRAGALTDGGLASLARAAQREDRPQDGEVVLEQTPTGGRSVFDVRAARLPDGSALLLLEDQTNANRAGDARRDFVANVSHELKTPIGAIGLLAEAIAEGADDPPAVRRFADRLEHESDRLTKLVTEIIDLSRLQFDNPVESPQAVSVDAVVAEAADRVRSSAEAKNIRILRGGREGLEVIGDKAQLVTAVNNLIDNAVAYSPEHTRVAIGVRDRGEAVEITVSDQGIGIPEDERARIFERFYRVDPARSRQTGGTGLGLSIVKHIAASHHGDVSVWSSHGAGSTFTLSLPRHPDTTDPDGGDPDMGDAGASNWAAGDSGKIGTRKVDAGKIGTGKIGTGKVEAGTGDSGTVAGTVDSGAAGTEPAATDEGVGQSPAARPTVSAGPSRRSTPAPSDSAALREGTT